MSTLLLDSSIFDNKEPKKIIVFSTSGIKAFLNTPSNITAIILFPLFAIFLLVVNFMLARMYRKLKKTIDPVNAEVLNLSYERASKLLQVFDVSKNTLLPYLSDIEGAKKHWITRGVGRKVEKIHDLFNYTHQNIARTLFVSPENTEPLSEEEKETFNYLNEVWGDDDDKTYARHTHYHLVKNLSKHENRSMECC